MTWLAPGSRLRGLPVFRPPPSGRRDGWSAAGVLAGLMGACCYSSFLLAGLLGSRLSPVDSFVSELEVRTQPASGMFRLCDVVAGALIVVLAAGVWRHMPADRRTGVGCVLLAAVGVASILDGVNPMPCPASTQPSCGRLEYTTRLLVQLHQGHTDSSVLGLAAAVASALLLDTRPRHARGPRPRPAGPAVGAALAGLGIAELALTFTGGHGVGAVERAQVLLLSGWLIGLSCRLFTGSDAFDRHPTPTDLRAQLARAGAGPTECELDGLRVEPAAAPARGGMGAAATEGPGTPTQQRARGDQETLTRSFGPRPGQAGRGWPGAARARRCGGAGRPDRFKRSSWWRSTAT